MPSILQKEKRLSISEHNTDTNTIQQLNCNSIITIVDPLTADANEEHQKNITTSPDIPYSIFTAKQKTMIVVIISLSSFVSAFSANIYYPALKVIQSVSKHYLNINNV